MRLLNAFEKAEFILNDASKGNLNFSVIASYKGPIDKGIVEKGLRHLQKIHPNLRSCLDTDRKLSHFVKTTLAPRLEEYSYKGTEHWKEVAKRDLADRFDRINEPLWKVSLLKGDNEGQLVVTFHHAIGDGICAMPMMDHLFQYFSAVLNNEAPSLKEYNDPIPATKSLYHLSAKEPLDDEPVAPLRTDKGLHTSFVKEVIDEAVTARVLRWTKSQGIKVHATLFAAFMQAVRRVINPPHEELLALTAVNFRQFFNPPVRKEVMALMRTCISDSFKVSGHEDFAALAKAVHSGVHNQLNEGQHVLNLKALEKKLEKNHSTQVWWNGSKFPDNTIGFSNLGQLDFTGTYKGGKVEMNDLYFVANVDPFIESSSNVIMGAVNFSGRTYLTLWFLAERMQDTIGQAILAEMHQILSKLTIPAHALSSTFESKEK